MRLLLHFMFVALATLLPLASLNAEQRESSAPQELRASSSSFVVHSYPGGPSATDVLDRCHRLREELRATWIGVLPSREWNPRCLVVLHRTRDSYCHAVGRGAEKTAGSSLIRFKGGRIVERRIDLLVQPAASLGSLAHEMTHVILAERFGGREPPRWADEGLAMLADSPAKQSMHGRNCQEAIETGRALRLVELLELSQFASPDQIAPFYGQSLSLVQFLMGRGSASQFIRFVEMSLVQGYDRALRKVYAIDGVAQLEDLWHRHAAGALALSSEVAVAGE
jgi:hypothetical protein